MKLEKKWELLLQTISNDKTIGVKSVDENDICFTTSPENLESLRSMLSDPDLLKEKILHLLSDKPNEESKKIESDISNGAKKQTDLQFDNSLSLLNKLFTEDFLNDIGFKMKSFQVIDDNIAHKAVIDLNGKTEARVNLDSAKFKILECSFPDRKSAADILLGKKEQISQDSDCGANTGTFGSQIISIKKGEIEINYGKLFQVAQAADGDINGSPIISASTSNDVQYIINKDYTIRYLHEIFKGVVFNKVEGGYYQPIMFQPDSPALQDCSFHILLDVSGSMSNSFEEAKAHFIDIIKQITNSVNDWQLSITAFNHALKTQTFSSLKNHDISHIGSFIKGLKADGSTNLYGAIHDSIDSIIKQNQHNTIILLTDGHDTEMKYTMDEIISSASQARQQSSQFAMYSMGIGAHYNQNFFESISKQIGFTHIDLNDVKELRDFEQYIDNIGKKRIVYEFVNSIKTILEQVPSGELVIGNIISPDAEVIQGDNKYKIGILDRMFNSVSELANDTFDAVLSYAVDYAKYVTHDSPSYFGKINSHYNSHIGEFGLNPAHFSAQDVPMIGSNICYANQSISDGM